MIVSVQSAHVAELADACASGAHGETLGGSNPLVSTAPISFSGSSEFEAFVMETTLPQQNPSFVRRTFAAIAARYDLANHLLSGGFDFLWRARAARIIASEKPRRILDLATGSGDLALALRKRLRTRWWLRRISACPCSRSREKARASACASGRTSVTVSGRQIRCADGRFWASQHGGVDEALQEMGRVLRPGEFSW